MSNKVTTMDKKDRFVIWTVGGKDYQLKLKTSGIKAAENKLGSNLLDFVMGGIPTLSVMLTVAKYALQAYNPDITTEDVEEMYDTYIEEGGGQTAFYIEVFMQIYSVSGFFSKAQQSEWTTRLESLKRGL